MRGLISIDILARILTIGFLSYTMAQVSETKETLQGQTITYTYVITRYPDKKKYPLAGTYLTLMKYWIKGNKWRREEIYDENRRIIIVSDGWRYTLFSLRSGEKTATKERLKKSEPVPIEHDPRKLLKEWLKKGIKKVGSGRVEGQECDVYEKKGQKVKIWVRKKDGLVIRIEEEGSLKFGNLELIKTVHEFKDIKIGVPIDDSLFTVPRDYKLKAEP